MKKSQFTDNQILTIRKEAAAGIRVPDLYRTHGMSDAKFYKWRAKFRGTDAAMVKRIKELEEDVCRRKAQRRAPAGNT
jgi:putative transposase